MAELTLHFEDYDQTGYLIRFGHKEHLEQILNGKIRFTSLKKYQRDENKNIGDENEGVHTYLHKDETLNISYCHPLFQNGKQIDISNNITSFKDYPDNNKFISCFSYITQKSIVENDIISKLLLSEPEWDNVLFISKTLDFITDMMNILKPYNLRYGRVTYLDYSVNQTNLNEFSKSKKFEYQKELRFSMDYNNEIDPKIRRIDSERLEVDLGKSYYGYIIPITDFQKCFTISKK